MTSWPSVAWESRFATSVDCFESIFNSIPRGGMLRRLPERGSRRRADPQRSTEWMVADSTRVGEAGNLRIILFGIGGLRVPLVRGR